MPTEYANDKEVENAVTDMLADDAYNEFDPLRNHEVKINTCIVVRTTKEGEDVPCKGDPVVLKKISPLEKLFIDADYILVVNNSAWKSASSTIVQQAMLHKGLMKINVEAVDGGATLSVRKPDVVEFSATMNRFGPYTDNLISLRETFVSAGKKLAKSLNSSN